MEDLAWGVLGLLGAVVGYAIEARMASRISLNEWRCADLERRVMDAEARIRELELDPVPPSPPGNKPIPPPPPQCPPPRVRTDPGV